MAIRLDAVLQAVELPAGIANLTAGLANVDTDTLTLGNSRSQSSQAYLSLLTIEKKELQTRRLQI